MRMNGFDPNWCQWVHRYIEKGNVGTRVNDDMSHYIQTKKGLCRLSPIIFNIIVDMLAIMIERAKDDGQVSRLISHLVDGGISVLQCADDTILFMEHDLDKALNMKLVLCIFEQLCGLKTNFNKSELYCFGRAKDLETKCKVLFRCDIGSLPLIYLGIPIHI
jgi:hypothetical protein